MELWGKLQQLQAYPACDFSEGARWTKAGAVGAALTGNGLGH